MLRNDPSNYATQNEMEMLKYLRAHKTTGGWRHKCKDHTDWNVLSIDRNGTQWLFVFTQLLNAWHILLQSGATARHLRSLWSITTQIPTLVAVTVKAASIYVLLAFIHRADLGTINKYYWHLFIFPSLGTASRCERSKLMGSHNFGRFGGDWHGLWWWRLPWSGITCNLTELKSRLSSIVWPAALNMVMNVNGETREGTKMKKNMNTITPVCCHVSGKEVKLN